MKTAFKALLLLCVISSQALLAYGPPTAPYIHPPGGARPGYTGGYSGAYGGGYSGGSSLYVPNYSYSAPSRYNVGQSYYGGGQQFGGFNGGFGGFQRQMPAYGSPFGYNQAQFYGGNQFGPRYIGGQQFGQRPYYGYGGPQQYFGGYGHQQYYGYGGYGQQQFGGGGGNNILGALLSMLLGGGGNGGSMFGGGNQYYQPQQQYYQPTQYASYQPQVGSYQQYPQVAPPPGLFGPATAPVQQQQYQQPVVQGPVLDQQPQQQQAPAVLPPDQQQQQPVDQFPPDLNQQPAPQQGPVAQQQPAAQQPIVRSDVARSDDTVASNPQPSNVPRNPREGYDLGDVRDPNLNPRQRRAMQVRLNMAASARRQLIWKPFYSRFKTCARDLGIPDCEPVAYSSLQHGRPTCHSSGRALDLFAIKCSDGLHMAHATSQRFFQDLPRANSYSTRNSGRFPQIIDCMVGTTPVRRGANLRVKNGLGALWHNGHHHTNGHHNHVHFSIGCGGMW